MEKFQNLQKRCEELSKEKLDKYLENMPRKWALTIRTYMEAAKAKSSNGRRYTSQWIYECAMLRIKSQKLYKKMLRDKFLPLPSLRTLQRYMQKLRPELGCFKRRVNVTDFVASSEI